MEDIGEMIKLARGADAFGNLALTVNPGIFRKTWRINSTVAKAVICLLAQYNPRTFLTGAPVDLGTTLAAYNAREFHHIYPKAFLAEQGIQFHESNIIANVCMLSQQDNNAISDRDPRDYFLDVSSDIRENIFRKALIPSECWDGAKPYADFVASRAKLIAAKAEELIMFGAPKTP
jgi:hypothetical protein